jgi:hypothetical protein
VTAGSRSGSVGVGFAILLEVALEQANRIIGSRTWWAVTSVL